MPIDVSLANYSNVIGLGLLTSRPVPSGKQRPEDIVQAVYLLIPLHGVCKLTDPDSFFDWSESQIILLDKCFSSSQLMTWLATADLLQQFY